MSRLPEVRSRSGFKPQGRIVTRRMSFPVGDWRSLTFGHVKSDEYFIYVEEDIVWDGLDNVLAYAFHNYVNLNGPTSAEDLAYEFNIDVDYADWIAGAMEDKGLSSEKVL